MSDTTPAIPDTTYVGFLLDETGSMQPIKEPTIKGFNTYLEGLQKDDAGKVEFTFVKFNSAHTTTVHVAVPAQDVPKLSNETYNPDDMTPLIDAMYKLILAMATALEQRSDKPLVLCVIQSDGEENASRQYTLEQLQDLIRDKKDAGWQFVFLGANMDAWKQSQQLGFAQAQTMSYAGANTESAFDAITANTTLYRSSGRIASLSFSEEQRIAAGDAFHQQQASTPTPRPTRRTVAVPTVPVTSARPSVVDDIDLTKKDA